MYYQYIIKRNRNRKKIKEERAKILAGRNMNAQPVQQKPVNNQAAVDEGSGLNDYLIIIILLVVAYLILKYKKLL